LDHLKARVALVVLDGFLAVTAMWGALLVVPQLPLSVLRFGPFTDFAIPAIALGSVGVVAAVGALAAPVRPALAAIASILAGGAIVVFEIVEAAAVGSLLNAPSGLDVHGYVALWLQPVYAIMGLTIVAVAFFGLYRPWHWRWGAVSEELNRVMPGDEIVANPTFDATRAVTVQAAPSQIWPWIAQIGFGRAQHPSVGYEVLDERTGIRAHRHQRTLEDIGQGRTRMLTRVRIKYPWTSPWVLFDLLLIEPWDFPMMRKCMLGIKRRAESLAGRRVIAA
jgi:hypothetical protein